MMQHDATRMMQVEWASATGTYDVSFTPDALAARVTTWMAADGVLVTGGPLSTQRAAPPPPLVARVQGTGLRSAVQGAWNVLWVAVHTTTGVPWGLGDESPLGLNATFTLGEVERMPIRATRPGSHVYVVLFKPETPGALKVQITLDGAAVGDSPYDIPVMTTSASPAPVAANSEFWTADAAAAGSPHRLLVLLADSGYRPAGAMATAVVTATVTGADGPQRVQVSVCCHMFRMRVAR
jgi:hypothetical protein